MSPDTLESHHQFADKYALDFPLLADPERRVIERYGTWGERIRDGKVSIGMLRTTFLIDRDGVIRKVYPQVNVEGHADAILADLRALQESR